MAMLTNRKDKSSLLSKKDICVTKKMPGHWLLDGLGKNTFYTEPCTVWHMYNLQNFPISIYWNELSQRHSTFMATWKWLHLQWFTVWDPRIENSVKLRQEEHEVTFIPFPSLLIYPEGGLSSDIGHWSSHVFKKQCPTATSQQLDDPFSGKDPMGVGSAWRVDSGNKAPWHHWTEGAKQVFFETKFVFVEERTYPIIEAQENPDVSEEYQTQIVSTHLGI